MALSAVNGLAYLHEMSIVHFDLKPDNLLLDGKLQPGYDGSVPSLKVADFGLSKQKWGREFVSGVRDLRLNSLPLLPASLFLPLPLFWRPCYLIGQCGPVHCCYTVSHPSCARDTVYPVTISYVGCKAANAGHSVSTKAGHNDGSAATFDSQMSSNNLFCTSNEMQCTVDHANQQLHA